MSTTPAGAATTAPLTLRTGCEVHHPGDPGYDRVRMPWNLAVDQRPDVVALPRTVEEVVDVVRAAAAAGLRVAPQATGHGAGPLGEQGLTGAVLLRTSALTGVTVDPVSRTARVLGGTTWDAVLEAAAPHGLTAAHGSAPDVGVIGYLLGGGLSFYGRRHGLGVNAVRALDVVLPDGTLRRVDADDAELFWAVRGGGGSVGVVVAVEIDLLPYPDVVAGMLLWGRDRAPEVLRAWREWTTGLPESVTTSLRVMSFPPLPELPPFLSGRDVVVVDGALLEDDERAAALLAPLRALEPEVDTMGRMPSAGLLAVHMDPPTPVPAVGDHALLGPLDDAADAAFLGQVGPGTRSGLMFAELRHLGGAFAREPEGGGALSRLSGEYAMLAVAVAPEPGAVVAGRAAAFAVVRAMAPWTVPGLAPTFAENRVEASRVHAADVLARLHAVRDRVDPDRVLQPAHSL